MNFNFLTSATLTWKCPRTDLSRSRWTHIGLFENVVLEYKETTRWKKVVGVPFRCRRRGGINAVNMPSDSRHNQCRQTIGKLSALGKLSRNYLLADSPPSRLADVGPTGFFHRVPYELELEKLWDDQNFDQRLITIKTRLIEYFREEWIKSAKHSRK